MSDSARSGTIYNVQVLRAIAALLVVFYHLREWTATRSINWEAGQAGVDIFFVISGFIIGHVTTRPVSVREFALHRIIRVVPLYWLLTLALFFGARLVPILLDGYRPPINALLCSLFFLPYRADPGAHSPLLFLGWTLNFEMFFYLLFAAAMLISHRHRIAIAAAAICALVAIGAMIPPTTPAAHLYTSPLMLEFVAGMGLSVLWQRQSVRPASSGYVLPCLLVIGAMLVALAISEVVVPEVPRVVRWGLPALGLVAAALIAERNGARLRARWILILGNASYAIYLSHPFVIKAAALILVKAGLAVPAFIASVALAFVVIAGIILFLLIERPLTQFLRRAVVS